MEKKKKEPEEYIIDIQEACSELGWDICIQDKNKVQGLVIGAEAYISEVIGQLEDGHDYEIWSYPTEDNPNLH
jgi:hypothetical protein